MNERETQALAPQELQQKTFTVEEIKRKLNDIDYCSGCEYDYCTMSGDGCPLDDIVNKIKSEFE